MRPADLDAVVIAQRREGVFAGSVSVGKAGERESVDVSVDAPVDAHAL